MSDTQAIQNLVKQYEDLRTEIHKVIVGQEDVVNQVLISIFSQGSYAMKIKGYATIKTQDDIKKFWFNNKETEAGINLMKYVLYGCFDERKNWKLALESKILKIKKVKYREIMGKGKRKDASLG